MQTVPVSSLPSVLRIRPRTALVASADGNFRQRIAEILTGLRWQVRVTEGGAQAWAEAQSSVPEAMIVDTWLPDLDLAEFLRDFRRSFPDVELLTADGDTSQEGPRSPYRQELLYALRRSQDNDTAIWNSAPGLNRGGPAPAPMRTDPWPAQPAVPLPAVRRCALLWTPVRRQPPPSSLLRLLYPPLPIQRQQAGSRPSANGCRS